MYHVLVIGVETNSVYECTHWKDALGYVKGWTKEDLARHGHGKVKKFRVEQLADKRNVEVAVFADGYYVGRIAKLGDN